jgi:hypothetical protein
MAQTTTGDFPEMTARAAVAFADYVALGPRRSLDKLCDRYRIATEPVPTRRLMTLKDWSVRFRWQHRLAVAASALVDARLDQATELDATSFLRTSELISDRLDWTQPENLDAILKMRESVRRPAQKATTTVNVTLDVRQAAEKVAAELGVPVDVVIAESYRLAEDEQP